MFIFFEMKYFIRNGMASPMLGEFHNIRKRIARFNVVLTQKYNLLYAVYMTMQYLI